MSSFGASRSLAGVPGGLPGREPLLPSPRLHRGTGISPQDAWSVVIERIRAVTGASAAAIAMREADEFICRASAGAAPPPGVALDHTQGLSAECIRTGTTVVCDDAEKDSRIGQETRRKLGLRSAVVMPLLRHEAVEGLIAVSSQQPSAFDSASLEKLRAVAWAIEIILFNSSASGFVEAVKQEIAAAHPPAEISLPEPDSDVPISDAYAAGDEQPWFETPSVLPEESPGRVPDADVALAIATEWNLASDIVPGLASPIETASAIEPAVPAVSGVAEQPPESPELELADTPRLASAEQPQLAEFELALDEAPPENLANEPPEPPTVEPELDLDDSAFEALPPPSERLATQPVEQVAPAAKTEAGPAPATEARSKAPVTSSPTPALAIAPPAPTPLPVQFQARVAASDILPPLKSPAVTAHVRSTESPRKASRPSRYPKVAFLMMVIAIGAGSVWILGRNASFFAKPQPAPAEQMIAAPASPQPIAPSPVQAAAQPAKGNAAELPHPGAQNQRDKNGPTSPALPAKPTVSAITVVAVATPTALKERVAESRQAQPTGQQPGAPATSALVLPTPEPAAKAKPSSEEAVAPPPIVAIASPMVAPPPPSVAPNLAKPVPAAPAPALPVPVLTPRIDATWVMLGAQLAGKSLSAPKLLKKVLPTYPDAARTAKRQGSVVLQAALDAEGRVSNLKVLDGDSALTEAASSALRTWLYEPARLGDKAAECSVLVTVNFRLAQ